MTRGQRLAPSSGSRLRSARWLGFRIAAVPAAGPAHESWWFRDVVPYRVAGEFIEILRVFHGARRWPEEPPE